MDNLMHMIKQTLLCLIFVALLVLFTSIPCYYNSSPDDKGTNSDFTLSVFEDGKIVESYGENQRAFKALHKTSTAIQNSLNSCKMISIWVFNGTIVSNTPIKQVTFNSTNSEVSFCEVDRARNFDERYSDSQSSFVVNGKEAQSFFRFGIVVKSHEVNYECDSINIDYQEVDQICMQKLADGFLEINVEYTNGSSQRKSYSISYLDYNETDPSYLISEVAL